MQQDKTYDLDFYNYRRAILFVIMISFIVRAFFAYSFELGNDEVYYWLLAANPAWNYFDHPPMFSWFINLFSFNLNFDSEIFVRMSSLIIYSINTWLFYIIGKEIKNERTGFIAALLYQSSIYSFVITGIMILPDTPLSLFWLLAMRSFLIALPSNHIDRREKKHLILSGVFIGLALISKYQSIIFWAGAGTFILLYKRAWLKKIHLYLAILLSIIIIAPFILPNIGAANSNIEFQTNRINLFNSLQPLNLAREFFGQLVYNNPINVVLTFIAIFYYRRRKFLERKKFKILIWLGIPGIFTFLFFSLFNATLPHWSAPSYYALMLISAAYLSEISTKRFPTINKVAIGLLGIVLILAFGQINHGILDSKQKVIPRELGSHDVSLDLYGWQQLAEKFIHKSYPKYPKTKTIIARKWFNAAHFDYYLAQTNSFKLIALGSPNDIHEYMRINKLRGGISTGEDAWFIAVSRSYQDPFKYFSNDFEHIEPIDTIPITRNQKIVEYAFVYHLKNYKNFKVSE
jgi:4-amino-4-deoxy-L-arabinose transferase-like glycosyltransferase